MITMNPYTSNKSKGKKMQKISVAAPSAKKDLRRIENQIIGKHLDIIIIKALGKEPLSGYGIISLVHREYGILIGSGRVYNLLHSLEKKHIIKTAKVDKAKYYVLDEEGKRILKLISNRKRMLKTILSIF